MFSRAKERSAARDQKGSVGAMLKLATTRAPLQRFVQQVLGEPVALAPPHEFERYAFEDREAARLAWVSRVVDEYRSVVVFAELLHALADAEAPFAIQAAMHGLIGDELRHTYQCAEVARWLGGFDDLNVDLEGLGVPNTHDSPRARVLEIVAREIVVAEEESIRVLKAYRDATEAPSIRATLAAILADEARHAAAGREILAELASVFTDDASQRMLDSLKVVMPEDRERLRRTYREGAIDGPGRGLGASLRVSDLEPLVR
jgi:hypothetical protein